MIKIVSEKEIVMSQAVTTKEIVVRKVTENYARNNVTAITNIGHVVLWEGEALDALNAKPEQWTDADVIARVKEIYGI